MCVDIFITHNKLQKILGALIQFYVDWLSKLLFRKEDVSATKTLRLHCELLFPTV